VGDLGLTTGISAARLQGDHQTPRRELHYPASRQLGKAERRRSEEQDSDPADQGSHRRCCTIPKGRVSTGQEVLKRRSFGWSSPTRPSINDLVYELSKPLGCPCARYLALGTNVRRKRAFIAGWNASGAP